MRFVLPAILLVGLWATVALTQPALPPFPTNVARPHLPTNLPRARVAANTNHPAPAARPPGTGALDAHGHAHAHAHGPTPIATNRLRAVPQMRAAPGQLQPATHLAWDANSKTIPVKEGATNVHLAFWVTNVSTAEVLVHAVRTSCGCAAAQLPAYPWRLKPGDNGPIAVDIDLRSKSGSFSKSVIVDTSTGIKTLLVHLQLPGSPNPSAGMDVERLKNMRMAMVDRQVVFKGECAKCHAEPAAGKFGEPLYAVACGICHDSPQRAALVPDLKKLSHPTPPEHWRKWIVEGKVGSMMPAFAKAANGPLSEEQIESLVEFLSNTIPSKPAQAAANTTDSKAP